MHGAYCVGLIMPNFRKISVNLHRCSDFSPLLLLIKCKKITELDMRFDKNFAIWRSHERAIGMWNLLKMVQKFSTTAKKTNKTSNDKILDSALYMPYQYHSNLGWLGSRVISVLESGAEGPGFQSQSWCCRITVLGKLFTPIVPLFTKQQSW